MRWLKHLLSVGCLLAAAGIALATGLSDHTQDYGKVPVPPGGVVQLPKGTVVVYFSQVGDGSDPIRQVTTPFSFQVVPLGGGPPVPVASNGNKASVLAFQRSETIGELGAVAKLHVPASGEYSVNADANVPPGTSYLKLGRNAGTAVVSKWKLYAGLVLAAILLNFIPTPKPKRRWEDEGRAPTGWSSDPRAPYAG